MKKRKKISIKPNRLVFRNPRTDVLIVSTDNSMRENIGRRLDSRLKLVSISSQNAGHGMVDRAGKILRWVIGKSVRAGVLEIKNMDSNLSLGAWMEIIEQSRGLEYHKARFVYISLPSEDITKFVLAFSGTGVIDLTIQIGYGGNGGNLYRVGPGMTMGGDQKLVALIHSVVSYNFRQGRMWNFLMCLRRQQNSLYRIKGVLEIIYNYISFTGGYPR